MCAEFTHIHTYLPDDNESISQVNVMHTTVHTRKRGINFYLDLDLLKAHRETKTTVIRKYLYFLCTLPSVHFCENSCLFATYQKNVSNKKLIEEFFVHVICLVLSFLWFDFVCCWDETFSSNPIHRPPYFLSITLHSLHIYNFYNRSEVKVIITMISSSSSSKYTVKIKSTPHHQQQRIANRVYFTWILHYTHKSI